MKHFWLLVFLPFLACQTPPAAQAPSPKTEKLSLAPEALRHANIAVESARLESLGGSIEAPGKLTWNEDRTARIGVVATGKVIHVYAHVGDTVKEQQLLARMHTHDVHDTKALLRQARAERDRATSALEQARRTEARMKRLLELKAVSEAQYEQAVLERKTAESLLRVALAGVDKEVQHLTEFLEIPADDEDASPHKHNDEDELVPVKSTLAGIVVERKVTPGTVVSIGQEAFIVADPSSLWCIANFPENALPYLRTGMSVEVEVRAFPGRRFPARILRLGESIDPATRTLQVRAELPSHGLLKPEMLAVIRINLPAATSLVVPEAALHDLNGKTVVFVEASPGNFQPREVQAVVRDGWAHISSGLTAGDRVATTGSYFLKSELLKAEGQ
jgi:cobalt-zinc-cadmium efflux system membrane fusion protein